MSTGSRYTPVERFMMAAWLIAEGSPMAVQTRWRREFGRNMEAPTRKTIRDVHTSAMTYGLALARRLPAHPVTSDTNIDRVCLFFEEQPKTSQVKASSSLGISRRSIGRMMKLEGFHPYKLKLHQHLGPEDHASRADFAQEMLDALHDGQASIELIMFSDEAAFHTTSHVNRHNSIYWAQTNPAEHYATKPVASPKVTVWAAVWHGGIVGPFFYRDNVKSNNYLEMLDNWLLPQLQEIPAFRQRELVFQQDGAPPHWGSDVRMWLNNKFPGRWIGRGRASDNRLTAWPALSPDLSVCDFWLWGHVKQIVYSKKTTFDTVDELIEVIKESFKELSTEVRVKALLSFENRLNMILEKDGGYIE